MLRQVRKRFWAVHLLTLLLCGFFGARAAGQYLTGAVASPVPVRGPERQPVTGPDALPRSDALARSIEPIVARNIFCSDCAPPPPTVVTVKGGAGLTRTTLPLRLLATVIDVDNEDDGFASILDTSSGRTRVAAVGERLALEARLVAVEARRILLENSGRQEFLPLEEEPAPAGAQAGPRRRVADETGASAVRAVGPGRYEIPADLLQRTLSNTTQLASLARVIPAQLQGQPAGFMLSAIRPGSLYTQLGIQEGDIIQAINGKTIRSPEDALQVYSALRHAQHVTIGLLRRSQPVSYDYTITNR